VAQGSVRPITVQKPGRLALGLLQKWGTKNSNL
jgi:hypothetical protein